MITYLPIEGVHESLLMTVSHSAGRRHAELYREERVNAYSVAIYSWRKLEGYDVYATADEAIHAIEEWAS